MTMSGLFDEVSASLLRGLRISASVEHRVVTLGIQEHADSYGANNWE
jgi:hypothetical protein